MLSISVVNIVFGVLLGIAFYGLIWSILKETRFACYSYFAYIFFPFEIVSYLIWARKERKLHGKLPWE